MKTADVCGGVSGKKWSGYLTRTGNNQKGRVLAVILWTYRLKK